MMDNPYNDYSGPQYSDWVLNQLPEGARHSITQAPPPPPVPVQTHIPVLPKIVYVDVYGQPMHPDEFQAAKRLWSGATWEDPWGLVNPFDDQGNISPEGLAAGYTPEMIPAAAQLRKKDDLWHLPQ